MTLISNNTDFSQKSKDKSISKMIAHSGYKNLVSKFTITIGGEISDSDLEEMEFIYPEYKIVRA